MLLENVPILVFFHSMIIDFSIKIAMVHVENGPGHSIYRGEKRKMPLSLSYSKSIAKFEAFRKDISSKLLEMCLYLLNIFRYHFRWCFVWLKKWKIISCKF